jgi:uncharacterized protein YuzE
MIKTKRPYVRPYVTVDRTVDAAYIYLVDIRPGEVADTVDVEHGDGPTLNLDFDAEGRLLGIELLSVNLLHPTLLPSHDPLAPKRPDDPPDGSANESEL